MRQSRSQLVVPRLTGQKEDVVVGLSVPKLLQGGCVTVERESQQSQVKQWGREEDDEYESPHMKRFEFAKDEEKRDGAEIESKPLEHEAQVPVRKKREERTEETDGVSGDQEDPSFVQHKVHLLEHVYNKKCFMKVCSLY